MLEEITVPSNYSGTIGEENSILESIQKNFTELADKIDLLPSDVMQFETHVIDFEQYEIDVYFEDNLKKARIVINDSNIEIRIGDKIVKVSSDGDVV